MRAPLVATKLRFSIWSWTPFYYKVAILQPELVLRALDLRYKAAIVKLELKTCTLRARLVLQSCDFRAGAQNLYFAYYTCTSKLRSSSRSWKLVLHLHTSRTRLVLQSCDSPARAGTTKLRFSSQSWKPALCVLDLYYKVVIFQLELEACTSRTRLVLLETCTSRTRLVQQSRDFPDGAGNRYFAH